MKKWMVLLVMASMLLLLAGCGDSEKVIEGSATNPSSASAETGGEAKPDASQENGGQNSGKGYTFTVQDTTVQIDADMSVVTEALGEPLSYYEAPSCAFDGMDKIYTYAGFTVQTYPDNNNIYMIVLKDDSVATEEGVSIGDSREQVEQAYGSEYTEETGKIVYKKDGMKLGFIFQEDEVVSIEYSSTAYDE